MSRRDREQDLERMLAEPDAGGAATEAARLAELARRVGRLNAASPAIDERRVWLRVRAGMLTEPRERQRGLPRLIFFLLALTPRPVLAGGLAVVLLAVAAFAAVLLQPQENASAAFLNEVEQMAQASGVAAGRGALTAGQSTALEERALGLLELASRPDVLSGLRATEADLAYERLAQARSALAAVVGDNPGDTRALAALAAISGLLDPPQGPDASRASTPAQLEAAPPMAATPDVENIEAPPASPSTPASAPGASVTADGAPQGRGPDAARTSEAGDSRGSRAPDAVASPLGSAVSATQSACARVFDSVSLTACTSEAATASAACTGGQGADGCQAAIGAAVASAQQRVQRVGEDCQRLPTSKARDACSEATNRSRSGTGRGGDNNNGRSGGGGRNESDSRGRRD